MDKLLPLELLQEIANNLPLNQYQAFKSCSKSLRRLNKIPFLNFHAYKETTRYFKQINRPIQTSCCRMHLNIDHICDESFAFLAFNGHLEVSTVLNRNPNAVTKDMKLKAYQWIIMEDSSESSVKLLISLLKDGNIDPNLTIQFKCLQQEVVQGKSIFWACYRNHTNLVETLLTFNSLDFTCKDGILC